MVSEVPSGRRRSRSRSNEKRRETAEQGKDHDRSSGQQDRQTSRARSKSPLSGHDPATERRRPTWFDIQPVAGAPPPISELPGAVKVIPESLSGNLVSSAQSGAANQQATRHARRIYVGGLPPHTKEEDIATFFRYGFVLFILGDF